MCGAPYLPCECNNNDNNKFQNKPATKQIQKCSYTDYFCNSKTSNHMSQAGALSLQASQPIWSGKDVPVCMDTIKYILSKLGEMYSLQKKPETQHDSAPSSEDSMNEVMQTFHDKIECPAGPRLMLQYDR